MAFITRMTMADVPRRRWELLAFSCVGAFMGPLDGSILAVAFPVLSPDLNLGFAAALWVQAAYLVAMAVLLIPLGRLADQHGRMRYYLIGVGLFTIGSALAAASMNGAWMIVSRIVQGAGAALLVGTSAAIVTAAFPPRERGKALGINVMAVYLGLSVGPPLGGFIVDALSWRWVFIVNIPIGILVLLWGSRLLPRDEAGHAEAPAPDLIGSALLGTFLLGLLVPLTFIGHWGWRSPQTIVLLVVSLIALVVFVLVERRLRAPLLDLNLVLRNRLFAAANGAAFLNYLGVGALSILTAILLEVVLGYGPRTAGWILLSQPLLMAGLSPLSGRLSDRIGSRVLATGGMATIAAGMVVLGLITRDTGLWQLLVGLGLVGIGAAAFSAPNSSAIMGSVRRDQLGLASSFLGTMRVTGMAISVALLGGIAASHLGTEGGRVIFTQGGRAAPAVIAAAADGYLAGYRAALLTAAALTAVGAAISLIRGRHEPEQRTT